MANIKKLAVMAGMATMTALPIKTLSQTPDKKAKETAVEIDPYALSLEIRMMRADSANIATLTKFCGKYFDARDNAAKSAGNTLRTLLDVYTRVHTQMASGNMPCDTVLLNQINKLVENTTETIEKNNAAFRAVDRYVTNGVTIANPDSKNPLEINLNLEYARKLLKMVDAQQNQK